MHREVSDEKKTCAAMMAEKIGGANCNGIDVAVVFDDANILSPVASGFENVVGVVLAQRFITEEDQEQSVVDVGSKGRKVFRLLFQPERGAGGENFYVGWIFNVHSAQGGEFADGTFDQLTRRPSTEHGKNFKETAFGNHG